ncbi:hypothetical protein LTR36_002331 [Oleoguttula mirabilis]|uniref:Translation initiation factor eIF2B subunit gamma n=1 Tax=Oleoguttula mirabilis TaxID=1507867 RepID=A0AAV9JLP7_9PEZI|nr:hypothetical protein LTR36_002331 [Oleoguttula mirabilis]
MPHATVPSPGLQALILCGPGVSLNTFTSNPKDLPKALIPIANRPMVWYPLDWCHRMGINDITLVTPPESSEAVAAALKTHPALTGLRFKPDVLAPEELLQTTGTGELLRLPEVQKAITSDFILLPCDLISELDGSSILQQWMTLNPPSTSGKKLRWKGGLSVFYPTQGLEGVSTKKDETDFLATVPLPKSAVPPPHGSLRPHIEEIVTFMPTDTLNDKLEEDKGHLRVRQSLLNRHGRVKMRMKHRDAHVYIFPQWVKEFVAKNERFDSVSEDVLGWWAKAGWQEGLAEKLGLDEVLGEKKAEDDEMNGDLADDEEIDPSSLSSTKAAKPVQQAATTASFASRVGGTSAPTPKDRIATPPLLAYVQPAPSPSSPLQPLIRRVDTTAQLASISLYLARQPADHPLAHEHNVHPTASIGLQSRISQEDSLVGHNVTMGIRCNVKESVIGANCEIGSNVRLTKCVLMEGVQVGDGVVMTGCIIGRRARIQGVKAAPVEPAAAAQGAGGEGGESAAAAGDKKGKKKKGGAADDGEEERTRLTDCEVAPNYVVEAGTEAKGEKLMAFDTEGVVDEDMHDGEEDEQGVEEED